MKKKILLIILAFGFILKIDAHPSWGLIVDDFGNIFFADIAHEGRGALWKYSSDGKLELLLSDFHAHNVNFDKEGNLISAHGEGNHTLIRYNTDTTIDTLFTTRDHKAFFGGSCAYSRTGNVLFSADKHIWKLVNGKREKISEYKFEWTQTIYGDEDGNVYAPEIGAYEGAVIKIDKNGDARVIAKNLIKKLDRPRDKHNDVLLGISKDPDGNICIAELAGQRILKIFDNGIVEELYTSEENWFPTASYFKDCDLYILENRFGKSGLEGPQIVKINEQGQKEVVFNFENYHTKH